MRKRAFPLPVRWLAITAIFFTIPIFSSGSSGRLLPYDGDGLQRILQHGPWPPAPRRDPSNRVSGQPAAIELGRSLFFEPRLSRTGTASCATCHVPALAFTDGKPRGQGFMLLDRNTPSLLNLSQQRWFGWDGAHDNLWAQSVRPLLDRREMASTPERVGRLLRSDQKLAAGYAAAFGHAPGTDDEALTVDVGKALAAFQETLVSAPTPFDAFRDALARGDFAAAAQYPEAAQRGLRIFIGRGNCAVCHFGPNFSNGEFADVGIPYFLGEGRVDEGRYGGIRRLLDSPLNLLGGFNDDPTRSTATGTRHVEQSQRNWGEFRVPSLRNLVHTAPYMHNGRLASLRDVVRHYSELNEDRLHADGEKILRPLRLQPSEVGDLVAFLESLSVPTGPASAGTKPGFPP